MNMCCTLNIWYWEPLQVMVDYIKAMEMTKPFTLALNLTTSWEIIKLTKMKKITLKCDECDVYRLFLLIETNFNDIWSYLVLVGYRKSL